ncbi:MAG: hypothetical protein K0S82_2752, partial [Gaiellaceae bacterium]|nr:hypothetical protein [Gaiellaceae bacterium]
MLGYPARRLFHAAVKAYGDGRYDRARRLLRLRLLIRPSDRTARLYLACAERQLGRIEDARRTITQVGDINRYSDSDFLRVWRFVSSEAPELIVPLTDKLLGRGSGGPQLGDTWQRSNAPTDAGEPLYRFGFICFAAADHPEGDRTWAEIAASWRRVEVDEFVVYHHHETPLRYQRGDGGSVVLIGHAFAVPADRTVEAVLNELVAAETDELFFERLDALSGRFSLLVLKDSAKRVFHDPIGSRSLFYRASGAFCVSSHAELIANAFGHRRSQAVRELMATDRYMKRDVKYLPGDLTVYEEVYALVPNNYYDVAGAKTVRYWPRRDR